MTTRDDTQYGKAVRDFKRALVASTLLAVHGNRTRAARNLGISRSMIQYLIRTLGVGVPVGAKPA